MWSIICDSVNPWSNLPSKCIGGARMAAGTVASMSASTESNPQADAMADCSAGVTELCRRGKVSLGCSADTETCRACECWCARGRFPAAAAVAGARVVTPRDGAGDVVDPAAASRRRSCARLARRRARSILGRVGWVRERAAGREEGNGRGLGFRFLPLLPRRAAELLGRRVIWLASNIYRCVRGRQQKEKNPEMFLLLLLGADGRVGLASYCGVR